MSIHVKFAIQNVVLKVEKKLQKFSLQGLFSWLFDKMFIEVSKFHETSPTQKNFLLRAWYTRKIPLK